MKFILLVPGVVLIVMTALARLRSARWWIRFADYPRMQIACGLAAVLILHAALIGWGTALDVGFGLALSAALACQAIRILPYTRLWPRQVKQDRSPDPDRSLRLLISNVLMENRTADRLLRLIRDKDPDLVLLLETDDWWRDELEVLDRDYPFRLKQPQGNYYGLHFFSKLELRSPRVRFLVEGEIPSVQAGVRLPSGDWIEFSGLHPRPPQVEENTETRDAEILIVAREIRADGRPLDRGGRPQRCGLVAHDAPLSAHQRMPGSPPGPGHVQHLPRRLSDLPLAPGPHLPRGLVHAGAAGAAPPYRFGPLPGLG
ncbi:hypothetical protein Rumeso_03488 [Rubellimicrobium mesophilum DSM 19309]|uniref:Endonuclease/exonuclease/phosphatase domain-containing protein n=1 Tax=Rubellimicrobium mesophilum DSM 19309 TaxID=442562 RepID=A0A017HKV5_9RHOB|nr:endonuclease/exonuclease/phosphatase family protein [Rubellimicrobium mesophilum]EYD74976.1 hypothetical protein Rumeso_03488 [Rubellimicrobium mesophilum DSM 19309]